MRTWFITGSSRGFGVLIAREALAAGDAVVATARNPKQVADALGEHPNLLVMPLDVTDELQAQAAVAAAVERFEKIDILLNNAGYGLIGAVEECTPEEVEKVYRTNVFGLLGVTRAVLPHMRARRSGMIINISSVGGYSSKVGSGIYCSTKFAVEGLSETLAAELAPLGIKVMIVEPGVFRTDFFDPRSVEVTPSRIADYVQTAGATRERVVRLNHLQPGDPAKLATALTRLTREPNPPLRIAFGSDTVAAIEDKNAFVAEELARWREISISTDFPE
jgi:NAD(P)-dependent dehydrogenase (short-subunit alcohol dehydrogenase family)